MKVMRLSSLHGNQPLFLGVLWILHKNYAVINETNRNIVVTSLDILADISILAAIDQIL